MTKRIFIALLALVMTVQLSGCSTGGSSGDGDVAESNDESFSEEGEDDFADSSEEATDDGGGGEEEQVAEEKAPEDSGDDLSLDDEGTETAENADAPAEGGEAVADGAEELSLDEPESLPEEVASSEDPAAAAPPDTGANTPPPTDEPLFNDPPPDTQAAAPAPTEPPPMEASPEPAPADTASAPSEPAPVASFAPLQKMKDTAFEKNGANLNRVYLARPGDTVKGVSQKIYGKNRSKDLKSWNGFLSRGVKTGDKIYYESPKNPQDTNMMTYYDEIGAPPQTYVTKEGDNIRTLSKTLLGSKDSWKEIWSTNPAVESKGDLPAGVEIRYWPEGAEQMVAQNPAPTEQPMSPPQDMAMNEPPPMDPPPPQDPMPGSSPTNMASNDFPPPGDMPPPMDGAAGTAGGMPSDMAPPPPPPPQDVVPPPPPPEEPKPLAKKPPPAEAMGSGDPDTMMAMGFGGILLIAAALLFVVIRKNRAKRIDLGQTQV